MIELRIKQIEDLICKGQLSAAQVFTQMKQLALSSEGVNKLKADAVREWANCSGYSDGCETQYRVFEDAIDYANKLERGDL